MTNIPHQKLLIQMYDSLLTSFGPQHWWPGDTPFEIAVGAILTQNTNWGNVEKAIVNIKRVGALHPRKLYDMSHEQLSALIRPAGYFNVKARRLAEFLSFFLHHYKGSMANMKKKETAALRHELLSVKGIGPETADSILLYALEKPVFVIDSYTKRVLVRHKIIPEDATYHEIQEFFRRNLPEDVRLFNEYHALFVMAGKHYCKPKPRCGECPLEGI